MKALKYSDISLVPKYSDVYSRVDCDTSIQIADHKFKLPIIPANMKSVMDMRLAKWMSENDYFYIMHRFGRKLSDDVGIANSEDWKTISFSAGVQMADKIEVLNISKNSNLRLDFLTIDIAHGYCERMRIMLEHVKKRLPDTIVIAGNVTTPDAVVALSNWGADIIKVGIGQGSPCTTKDKTGFTVPMFTATKSCGDCYQSRDKFDVGQKIPIIADGGIKCNGDIAKALVAGGDLVMAGGMFAACTDSPAVTSTINDVPHKAYFGSASAENKGHNNNIEGKLTNICSNNMSYEEKLNEIKQDLQSSISYGGGPDLGCLKDVKYFEL
ncbi:MAG: guanosine monophosphate reductase [Dehalococcoidia bacterium]|nr:guanosine monophosphate reductase [Dehalococcoidia bacterium]